MSLYRALLAAVALGTALACAPAHALQPGRDYVELPAQHRVDSRGQIEVAEFFWYKCPHCYHLEHDLARWSKKLPKHVVLKRVPAVPAESWAPLARAYYSLETLGLLPKLHAAMFQAIHVENVNLNDPETFFGWAAKQGADAAKLKAAYNSFGVESKVKQAAELTSLQLMKKGTGLFGQPEFLGVPTLVVNGKYLTSVSMTGNPQQLFMTLDALIAQEGRKGRK